MTKFSPASVSNEWVAITDTPPPVGERVIFVKNMNPGQTEGVCDWGRRSQDGTYKMEIMSDEPFAFTHWKHWEKSQ
jgi:hypothetical protein